MKKFGAFDFGVIMCVFVLGFIFSYLMGTYKNKQKAQLDALMQQFQGQKGQYEKALKNTKFYLKWKYRVKIAEKIYWVILVCSIYIFYKSPSMVNLVFI
jgi:hypothetical protein